MRLKTLLTLVSLALMSTGCSVLESALCMGGCDQRRNSASTSLVDYLYPNGEPPAQQESVPYLHLPLRVGIATLPSRGMQGLDSATKQRLLDNLQQRFSDQPYISEIVVIPEHYIGHSGSSTRLQQLERLYDVDVLALVSYDQVTHSTQNELSLGYLTVIGTLFLQGEEHEVSTLVDLAVVDPQSRTLLLRAGGVSTLAGNSTAFDAKKDRRTTGTEGFSVASAQMIDNFDVELAHFEERVKAGEANLRVARSGGGGAIGLWQLLWLALAASTVAMARRGSPARVRA